MSPQGYIVQYTPDHTCSATTGQSVGKPAVARGSKAVQVTGFNIEAYNR